MGTTTLCYFDDKTWNSASTLSWLVTGRVPRYNLKVKKSKKKTKTIFQKDAYSLDITIKLYIIASLDKVYCLKKWSLEF